MKYYITLMHDIVRHAKRFCDLEVLVFINCVGVANEFYYFNQCKDGMTFNKSIELSIDLLRR